MKKSIIAVASAMLLAGCGFTGGTATNNGSDLGNVLGSILGAVTQGDAVTNILYDVIGATKLSKEDVVGTWSYRGPGVAFTSENLLAKAGGEVAAAKARQDLEKPYQSIGIKSTNTYFTIDDGLLVPGASAPASAGVPYFELVRSGTFTEGAYAAFDYVDVRACISEA